MEVDMMKTQLISAALLATLLTGCGGDTQPAVEHFDVSKVVSNVPEPFYFELPSDKAIEITQHGPGLGPDDYAELSDFKVEEARGSWQIWVAHNVWSDPPGQKTDFMSRNRSMASFLSALMATKKQNDLDVEIIFLQVDKIPGQAAMAEAKGTRNMSLRPRGDNEFGCGFFWVDCADRYVISPFARVPEPGIKSQREWLMPLLQPKLDDIKEKGHKSKYYGYVAMGLLDNASDYWDWIDTNVFIVNPDGEVVDALSWKALTSGPTPKGVIERFIVAAGIDPDDVVKPTPSLSIPFKKADFLWVSVPGTRYGGDYIQNAVDTLAEMLK
jgi:hypothetical protein